MDNTLARDNHSSFQNNSSGAAAGDHREQDNFKFLFEDKEVDERFLHKFEVISILRGNLDPVQQYIDEIAYTNLDYKMSEHPDPTIGKLMRTQQMGVQYLLFLQELAKKKASLYAAEADGEKANIEKMRELRRKQELKIRQLEERNLAQEHLETLHEERLKKIRTAKKVVQTITAVGGRSAIL